MNARYDKAVCIVTLKSSKLHGQGSTLSAYADHQAPAPEPVTEVGIESGPSLVGKGEPT